MGGLYVLSFEFVTTAAVWRENPRDFLGVLGVLVVLLGGWKFEIRN
jgi:hypothetical protein